MVEGVTRIDPVETRGIPAEGVLEGPLPGNPRRAPILDRSAPEFGRPRGSDHRADVSDEGTDHPSLRQVYLILWLMVAGGALLAGFDYYTTPLAGRPLHPQHEIFAPSGSFGLLLAVTGTVLMFSGVLVYWARKWLPVLRGWGDIRDWLRTHVFLSTLGPFLIILHTGFTFGGTASWAFVCMLAVGLSGMVGLYLFAWIPRSRDGAVIPTAQLEAERVVLAERVWEVSDAHPEHIAILTEGLAVNRSPGYVSAFWVSLVYQISARRRQRHLAAALSIADTPQADLPEAVAVLLEQHRIETQLALSPAFTSLYKGWRRLHVPLALGTLVLVLAHISMVLGAWSGGGR